MPAPRSPRPERLRCRDLIAELAVSVRSSLEALEGIVESEERLHDFAESVLERRSIRVALRHQRQCSLVDPAERVGSRPALRRAAKPRNEIARSVVAATSPPAALVRSNAST